jgi:quinol-cytochrome oxidoreductase complex cytochrome b subunit
VIRYANLAVRFLLELCALGGLGYWGFQTGRGLLLKLGLGIGMALLGAVVWAMFGSPKAPRPATGLMRLLLEVAGGCGALGGRAPSG